MAGAEAVAEALAESVQQIVALSPDRVAEDGPEAFDPFRRAVTQASRGRDAPPSQLLGPVESKEMVFKFLVALHGSKKMYRRQVVAVMAVLMHEKLWLKSLLQIEGFPENLSEDLRLIVEEEQKTMENEPEEMPCLVRTKEDRLGWRSEERADLHRYEGDCAESGGFSMALDPGSRDDLLGAEYAGVFGFQPHRLAGLSWTGWTASGLLQSTEVSTLDRANESWTRFGWSSFKFGRLIANGKAFIAALMELKELESLANDQPGNVARLSPTFRDIGLRALSQATRHDGNATGRAQIGSNDLMATELGALEKNVDEMTKTRELPTAEDGELPRRLTALELTLLGIGACIGAGIFVLTGAEARIAGPSVAVSFLLAGMSSIFNGLCFAELATRLPVSGSSYLYAPRRLFGAA
ncbi:unnamed protein product [Cladocopium goreaui]|uniref:Cationic amino acid transporter 9, chloroplastic n=1 Tax=Cladocopium goreaui TaxID=2562237 RepID=A0A9P1GJ64_9DINO|nr:unnamed protein product [Cladocopium goreaui]